MLDIKWIRENIQTFDAAMAQRGSDCVASELIAIDEKRRKILAELQDLQEQRNTASREIGQALSMKDTARADQVKAEIAQIKSSIQAGEENARATSAELNDALAGIPNVPIEGVPVGADESANVVLRTVGEKPRMNFAPKEHFEIGENLGMMDFETAAKLAGSRFTVLRGDLARLERALGAFMLDLHTGEHGYTETVPPLLVREEVLFGTGQLPKFADDLFHTADGRWLIPTAEVPLTNIVREEIVDQSTLPMRLTALTPCFRAEAGAAGRDTRGMLRQHQFMKVELVSITEPQSSMAELDRMTAAAEEVLKRLGLHYRVVVLSTGDMGFAAQKTHDIEVWLPGQDTYREISSCSVCGEFQARRMNARYRVAGEKGTRFVHTLNGSGVALGRALIAVVENFQNHDGSVTIPEVLRPYMGGMEKIEAA